MTNGVLYNTSLGYATSEKLLDGVVIYAAANSTGATYATNRGITWKDISLAPKDPSEGFTIDDATVTPTPTPTPAAQTVTKKANPMTVKGKTTKISFKKVSKKKQVVKRAKVLTIKNAKGKLSFKKVSGNKKITVNKKTGKVTVKKGLKKGTYKIKVKVRAAGNASYKASAYKTVTFRIKIK